MNLEIQFFFKIEVNSHIGVIYIFISEFTLWVLMKDKF